MTPHSAASQIVGAAVGMAVMAEVPWLPLTGETHTTRRGLPFWLPGRRRL
jgi:hypothetical protein